MQKIAFLALVTLAFVLTSHTAFACGGDMSKDTHGETSTEAVS